MKVWRSLTMYLALLLVVYTANFSAASFSADEQQIKPAKVVFSEKGAFSLTEESDDFDGYFNPPRGLRAVAPVFAAQVQTEPDYVLEIEFFAAELTAAFFKNLSNPPLAPIWHQLLTHHNSISRISGWKDGNALYTGRITYHS